MSNREAPPFGIKDKLGYMLGDVALSLIHI